jgi:hypothetical protein
VECKDLMIEAEVYSSRCKLHLTERNEDNNIKKKKKKKTKEQVYLHNRGVKIKCSRYR